MDLDRPYLVDDEEFDLEYHALRKPAEIFTLARRFITMLTNVPGSNSDLYFAGAQSIEGLGIGPLVPGMSLFHTATSFVVNKQGKMLLSFWAC